MDTNALVAQFSALDTVLHLHYASLITTPKLSEICGKALTMCGKRMSSQTLERILFFYPEAYKIVTHGPQTYDYYVTVPDNVPVAKFGAEIPARKLRFVDLLEYSGNSQKHDLEIPDLAHYAVVDVSIRPLTLLLPFSSRFLSPNTSPVKKTPRNSPTKITKATLLKNDRSKFSFKEKIAQVQSENAKGLSLLERIKLKEQNLQFRELPELNYNNQITGRLPAVYDVLYELSQTQEAKTKSFLLTKVALIVQDSIFLRVAESEILDIIKELQLKLGQEKIHIVTRGGVRALRISQLDRNSDLNLIR